MKEEFLNNNTVLIRTFTEEDIAKMERDPRWKDMMTESFKKHLRESKLIADI